MGVSADWTRILNHLGHRAPTTRAALRPGDPHVADHVEREIGGTIPGDLRDFWASCGGARFGMSADVFPPYYSPYSPAEALACRRHLTDVALDWTAGVADLFASPEALLPVARTGSGVYLVVDLRSGRRCGRVLELDHRLGTLSVSGRSSVGELVDVVRRAVVEGRVVDGYRAGVQDGRLVWDLAEFSLLGTSALWISAG
jgi:hypothetical protein